jgi:hypothetical protein
MSVTEATIHSATPSGAMPELVAGLAVIVLTILGLAGVAPNFLVAIATIVFGVGLLLFGASEVATLNRCLSQRAAGNAVVGLALNGWSTIFLVGLGGIVLGILALLGVATTTLVAIAVIAFGGALLLNSRAAMHVRLLAAPTPLQDEAQRRLAEDMAGDLAGTQTMSGLTAIVLGILALCGFAPVVLVFIALLALGCFILLSSSAFGSGLTQIFRAN